MKARDLIPGWPRGRSQRRCWPSAIDPNRPFNRIYFRDPVDIRYLEDWEDERKERSRKAAMMEAYYRLLMDTVIRGSDHVHAKQDMNERRECMSIITRVDNAWDGTVRAIGPLGCGCCPFGKHEPWVKPIPERDRG